MMVTLTLAIAISPQLLRYAFSVITPDIQLPLRYCRHAFTIDYAVTMAASEMRLRYADTPLAIIYY